MQELEREALQENAGWWTSSVPTSATCTSQLLDHLHGPMPLTFCLPTRSTQAIAAGSRGTWGGGPMCTSAKICWTSQSSMTSTSHGPRHAQEFCTCHVSLGVFSSLVHGCSILLLRVEVLQTCGIRCCSRHVKLVPKSLPFRRTLLEGIPLATP